MIDPKVLALNEMILTITGTVFFGVGFLIAFLEFAGAVNLFLNNSDRPCKRIGIPVALGIFTLLCTGVFVLAAFNMFGR